MSEKINIFWFRRDLRLDDNVGFYKALRGAYPVIPIFIFDSEILEKLPKDDARVTFIHNTVQSMRDILQKEYKSSLAMYHGKPEDIFKMLSETYEVDTVYTNRDYEPYATARDKAIGNLLKKDDIDLRVREAADILGISTLKRLKIR